MQLILSKTTDADNVINKTLTGQTTIVVNLKRDVNISSPEIILLVDGIDYDEFNYCEMPELGRKYFISAVEILNNRMVKLSLNCDVLETYKADILTSNARLMRNIKTGDYLNTSIEHSFLTTVSLHNSNKGFEGSPTMILTTIGG